VPEDSEETKSANQYGSLPLYSFYSVIILINIDMISSMCSSTLTETSIIMKQEGVVDLGSHLGWMNVLKNEKRYSWMWHTILSFSVAVCLYFLVELFHILILSEQIKVILF